MPAHTPLILLTLAVLAFVGLSVWFSSRYAWWRPPLPASRPRVLMYHMIAPHRPGARFNKLRVPPAMFERQLEYLARRGAHFVFASELFHDSPPPHHAVCLTFDDGYADNLLAADPILARFNARATLFLVGDLAGNPGWSSKKKAHHTDDELATEPKLTDEQVRALLATGRWELGGHTVSHAHLPSLADEDARQEIVAARDDFRARFGVETPTFAYPFGHFQPTHAEAVKDAGYRGAFTADPGIAARPYCDPFAVPRIKASGKDNLLAFVMRLRGGKRGFKR